VKILVTGATGFVGRHFVPRISELHEVTCVVRGRAAAGELGTAKTIVADLTDPAFTDLLPSDVEVVVHLAQAYLPFPERAHDLFLVNAASTHHLAEFSRRTGVRRVVFASSGSVYRPSREPLREDSATVPPAYHPATKLIGEMILRQYESYFSVASLRLFAPYGPGQVDRLIPRLFEGIAAGTPVTLSRGGEPRINPIHVDDLVAILERAVEDTASYTVNVAGPRAVSIRDLAEMIGTIIGRTPAFVERDGDVAGDFVADTSLMQQLFDVAELTSPERGLQTMVGVATTRAH
jgi:nucleoside-diphosphate-sugar epimerase